MPLLKRREEPEPMDQLHTKVKAKTMQALKAYAEFLNTTHADVIEQAVEYIIRHDKDFVDTQACTRSDTRSGSKVASVDRKAAAS